MGTNWRSRVFDWMVLSEGSTRSLGMLRVGMVALIWCRWASLMILVPSMGLGRMILSGCFFLGTGLMFVGLWTRWSAALTAAVMVAIYYVFGIYLGVDGWAGHHTCLLMMSAVLLALSPCGKSFSVDRLLAVRRARVGGDLVPPEHGALWALRLMQVQVFCIYFWAVVDKLNIGYLNGDRLEAIFMRLYFGSSYPEWGGFELICLLMSWVAVLVEAILAFGLLVPRLLRYVIPLGILFHVTLYVLLPVSVFSLNMILLYLAFVPVAMAHRWWDEVIVGA